MHLDADPLEPPDADAPSPATPSPNPTPRPDEPDDVTLEIAALRMAIEFYPAEHAAHLANPGNRQAAMKFLARTAVTMRMLKRDRYLLAQSIGLAKATNF